PLTLRFTDGLEASAGLTIASNSDVSKISFKTSSENIKVSEIRIGEGVIYSTVKASLVSVENYTADHAYIDVIGGKSTLRVPILFSHSRKNRK
ncbi:MAG: hypothetical protein AABP62_21960, partial [Planctomycetota bacterium]